MTKLNGTALIEVDIFGSTGAQRAGSRNRLPTFAALSQVCSRFIKGRGLPRSEQAGRVVRIKRSDLSRAKKAEDRRGARADLARSRE